MDEEQFWSDALYVHMNYEQVYLSEFGTVMLNESNDFNIQQPFKFGVNLNNSRVCVLI